MSLSLSEIAQRSGFGLHRLSQLAAVGYFPSVKVGQRRTDVEQPWADAVVVLLRAGITSGPVIRQVLDRPETFAAATGRVAELFRQAYP